MVNVADSGPFRVETEAPFDYCKRPILREILSDGWASDENANKLSPDVFKECEAPLRMRLAP
jgi:hypothetical protein